MKSRPARSPFRARRAFTLIELLTVIAIIGILAAILVPTVGKVRQTARKGASASNLRQIAVAFSLHANEHRRFPDQNGPSVMVGAGKRGSGAGATGTAASAYALDATRRPLNPYLGLGTVTPDSVVPVAQSPGDLAPDGWYETAGSSYGYANVLIDGSRQALTNAQGRGLDPAQVTQPSRQLCAWEVGGYLLALRGTTGPIKASDYWFTTPGENKFNVAFVDGRVAFLRIDPNQLTTNTYSFVRIP